MIHDRIAMIVKKIAVEWTKEERQRQEEMFDKLNPALQDMSMDQIFHHIKWSWKPDEAKGSRLAHDIIGRLSYLKKAVPFKKELSQIVREGKALRGRDLLDFYVGMQAALPYFFTADDKLLAMFKEGMEIIEKVIRKNLVRPDRKKMSPLEAELYLNRRN